jgi:hypothetical protein
MPSLEAAREGTVINLNVPDRAPEHVRGLRRAQLARFGQVQMTIAEATDNYVRMSIKEERRSPSRAPTSPSCWTAGQPSRRSTPSRPTTPSSCRWRMRIARVYCPVE